MTRKEEIQQAAERLAETKRTGDARYQCLYDFEFAAEWADRTMIDRACEWLKQDMVDSLAFQGRLHRMEIIEGIVENFRKAMED